VISLKDSWREQQRQRQQEVAQRQQQVQDLLAGLQRDRQTKALQLHDDLSLFQLELQENTRNFLARVSQERQAQAQQVTQELREFAQTLQAQTAHFLTLIATDRAVMAEQLAQDLNQFHTQLNETVALLRQALQQRVQQIKQDTQNLLTDSHNHRIQTHQQIVQDLMTFVDTLCAEVQTYLAELELMRQDRAQELQKTLKQTRDRRLAEVEILFQQLSQFRAELRQYCADLQASVWGTALLEDVPVSLIKPASASIKTSQPVVPAAVETVKPSTVAIEAIAAVPSSVPPANQPKPPQTDAGQLEENIYNYIHQLQGARLTEIESALGINRFQVVDALRALIKRGLITQRDRVYLIQEEASL
jgi:gas vesicle GvpC-like protein